jgi:hypothetical protein
MLVGAYGFCWADDVLYRYEGDVPPYDASAGWLIFDPCDGPCIESLEDAHFVLRWWESSNLVNYHLWIAHSDDPPPRAPNWVEWRFRSNNPIPNTSYSCDARLTTDILDVHELTFLFSDAAVSFSGDDWVGGLDPNDFHTYRYESMDGRSYNFSADGVVFTAGIDDEGNSAHYLQFGGEGGCTLDIMPRVNEWDYIRYGTILYGEQMVASDPPVGFVDARVHADLDRFTVTFDKPNYVYVDEISVEVTGGAAPAVIQTRRQDNGPPDTVEIVLDRPIPMGETTTFTFDDGVAVNVVNYTFVPGDTNGDGSVNLADVAAFQCCFGQTDLTGACLAIDIVSDQTINLGDFKEVIPLLSGP